MSRGRRSTRTDEERLRLFVTTVEDCVTSRAIQSGTLRPAVSIHGTIDGEVIEADLGDRDDVRSLMLSFRKLLAPKSEANFNGACNIVASRVRDAEVLETSRRHRAAWSEALSPGVALNVGGRVVGGKSAIDVWINGVLFHDDVDDRAWHDSLDPGSAATFQWEVQSTALACLSVAHSQRNLVNHVLEEGLLAVTAEGPS